jgi:hypothetical protein
VRVTGGAGLVLVTGVVAGAVDTDGAATWTSGTLGRGGFM